MNFTRITKTRPLAITINITYTLASKVCGTDIAPTLLGKIILKACGLLSGAVQALFITKEKRIFLIFFE
jgi:hypothetical protein